MVKEKEEENIKITAKDLLNAILGRSSKLRASDIHIEPLDNAMRIRFRVDGILKEDILRPLYELDPILTRIKVLANLDITNHNTPQDGHLEVILGSQNPAEEQSQQNQEGEHVDIRVSIFPTIRGDVAVLRLLNRSEMVVSLDDSGMDPETLATMKKMISKIYGMTLVTGPAGSGKTTTLYSILREKKGHGKNIITLEDPVEYYFDIDVRQSQIQPNQGFTFAKGTRAILRQDPDIIMIGEIRDSETAEHAMRASLGGRAVFSTVHSNSSIGTIARLLDMGVEKSLIAYALNGIIAQRLVRKNCEYCREEYQPDKEAIKYFKLENSNHKFVKGRGCEQCNNEGFKGRIGLFEMVELDDEFRSLIIDGAGMKTLQEYVNQGETKSLKQDAVEKVLNGQTTLEEVIRAV